MPPVVVSRRTESALPARIVLGTYLRALRTASRQTLEDVAGTTGLKVSTVSRWERAQSPMPAHGLAALLSAYGLRDARHINYLSKALPPQRGHDPDDARTTWMDVAGDEAVARYTAVLRKASEVVHYATVRVPPILRTAKYRAMILDPRWCVSPDEPMSFASAQWIHEVEWSSEQRRTVLLEDTLLHRHYGRPRMMTHQLNHFLDLMDGRVGTPVTVRVWPVTAYINVLPEVSLLTVSGHQLLARCDIAPSYSSGSDYTQSVFTALHNALNEAPTAAESYCMIRDAAVRMAKAAS